MKMFLRLLLPRRSSSVNENDFDNLIEKNIPNWSAIWHKLLEANLESSREGRRSKKRTGELHERIWQKISELVDEEEALIDLYTKAADAAKEEEIKLRTKTAILVEQLKKDRNLMKILQAME